MQTNFLFVSECNLCQIVSLGSREEEGLKYEQEIHQYFKCLILNSLWYLKCFLTCCPFYDQRKTKAHWSSLKILSWGVVYLHHTPCLIAHQYEGSKLRKDCNNYLHLQNKFLKANCHPCSMFELHIALQGVVGASLKRRLFVVYVCWNKYEKEALLVFVVVCPFMLTRGRDKAGEGVKHNYSLKGKKMVKSWFYSMNITNWHIDACFYVFIIQNTNNIYYTMVHFWIQLFFILKKETFHPTGWKESHLMKVITLLYPTWRAPPFMMKAITLHKDNSSNRLSSYAMNVITVYVNNIDPTWLIICCVFHIDWPAFLMVFRITGWY